MTDKQETTAQLVANLKGQGLTNRDIIQLYKESGRPGLIALVRRDDR